MTTQDLKDTLSLKQPHEVLEYIREQMRFKDKTEFQRDGILIAKQIFKEKTGIPVTQNDLIKK
jgi:hypothetical protein